MRTADAPSLTACAMRCAWTWPSSPGGVIQTISTGTPVFCVISLAAASAPVRAERKTGLVELLAMTAIFIAPLADAAPAAGAPAGCAVCDGLLPPPHAASITATHITA